MTIKSLDFFQYSKASSALLSAKQCVVLQRRNLYLKVKYYRYCSTSLACTDTAVGHGGHMVNRKANLLQLTFSLFIVV